MASVTVEVLTYELTTILKKNAPVRDGAKYPGARGDSPYTGNLKQNGIQTVVSGKEMVCEVGSPNAPYAPYTETRSRKAGWQKRSNEEFVRMISTLGVKVERV